VLEQITYYHIKADDMIKEIFKYVKRNGAYKNHVSEEEFNKTYDMIQDIVKYNKKQRN
jgi:hypothetical protein